MIHKLLLVSLIVVAATATSCGKSFDVYFTNPCDHALALATFTANPEIVENLDPYKSAELPALKTTLIEDAFGSKGAYSVDGQEIVEVDPDVLVNDTVVIPARFCQVDE